MHPVALHSLAFAVFKTKLSPATFSPGNGFEIFGNKWHERTLKAIAHKTAKHKCYRSIANAIYSILTAVLGASLDDWLR